MNASLLPSVRRFTMIELLIVITIITILATLLLPALSSARDRARDSKCAGNFRQIGYYLTMYIDGNRDFIPAINCNISRDEYGKWQDMLMTLYMPSVKIKDLCFADGPTEERVPKEIFRCPSHPEPYNGKINTPHYGLNAVANSGVYGYASGYKSTNVHFHPMKLGMIRRPAGRCAAFDIDRWAASAPGSGAQNRNQMVNSDAGGIGLWRHRRGGGSNILFADGHLESRKITRIPLKHNAEGGYFWGTVEQ